MGASVLQSSDGAKLGGPEVRIHLCQCSPGSQGLHGETRRESEKTNPNLPILTRECPNLQPELWNHHTFGKEKNVSWYSFSPDQATRSLENILRGKA
uniref:Uncharacterized protein n=1 Tax=Piliocolobus tephrosceles TaxID=591936 RepID=A0A8C9GXP9_9PRIM